MCKEHFVVEQIMIISIITSIILLFTALIVVRNIKTKGEVDRLNKQYENNVRVINEISDYNRILSLYNNEEDVKRLYHDMLYHVHSYTGNAILDFALSYKKKQAEMLGIKVEIVSIGGVGWEISETETVSVIFNILDNAIEGAAESKDALIYIDVLGGDVAKIKVTNSKNPSRKTDTYYTTTKKDVRAHGFGTFVIKEIIDRYGGVVNFEEHDKWFSTEIIL